MALTFGKKTSGPNQPPAGTVKFVIGNGVPPGGTGTVGGPYTIGDGAPITVNAVDAALLRSHVGVWLTES